MTMMICCCSCEEEKEEEEDSGDRRSMPHGLCGQQSNLLELCPRKRRIYIRNQLFFFSPNCMIDHPMSKDTQHNNNNNNNDPQRALSLSFSLSNTNRLQIESRDSRLVGVVMVVVVVAAITQCKFSKIAALRCTCMVDC
jgi:hypothetical protein